MADEYHPGCTGKRRHESRDAAKSIQRIFKRRGERQRVYHCMYCGGYHLTSDRGPRAPKQERDLALLANHGETAA